MIVIAEAKDMTSEQQRKTARMWCGEWAKHEGETKAEKQYDWFKCKYLWPEMVANDGDLEDLESKRKAEFPDMFRTVFGLSIFAENIHYSDATMQEFHDALSKFQMYLGTRGVNLTEPDRHHKIKQMAIESGKTQTVK